MAQLPTIQKLLVEDVPAEHRNWFSKFVQPLNEFISTVVANMTKNLTFPDNIRCQIKSLTFTKSASSFPLTFKANFRPAGVFRMDIQDVGDTPAALTSAIDHVWSYTQKQEVSIDNITGLTNGQTYQITFLVI